MYRNQGFTKDRDIGQGRLRIPSSIVNVIFSYTGGEILVNGKRNLAYVRLDVNRATGKVLEKELDHDQKSFLENIFGSLTNIGDNVSANVPYALSLYYSKTKQGGDVLTLPWLYGVNRVDDNIAEVSQFGDIRQVVNFYPFSNGNVPPTEEVCALHLGVVLGRKLGNRTLVSGDLANIVNKAIDVYTS
ncbi:MAG: hypothetical protein ABIJ08_05030 [Nanoarchaeota archaeon]